MEGNGEFDFWVICEDFIFGDFLRNFGEIGSLSEDYELPSIGDQQRK